MKIGEVAHLTGITVRALRHYDAIGLLKPSGISDTGYRLYSDADLQRLQQILFFRELDFPLSDIRDIMMNPAYDKAAALRRHKELLLQKRSRIDGLIALVDKHIKGENDMSFKQFDKSNIDKARQRYAEETRQRWGATDAYAEYEKKAANRSDAAQDMITGEGDEILRAFSAIRTMAPAAPEAQALVRRWQEHITANYYTCTLPILACLGQMYTADERFTGNIDRHGEGTAAFMAAAIEIYCKQ